MSQQVSQRPVGTLTRGTTHPNRLRRVDRWLVHHAADLLRTCADPVVVDLGFGANPITTWELSRRLAGVRAGITVLGLEIDPLRVAAARAGAVPHGCAAGDVEFGVGGFEVPLGQLASRSSAPRLPAASSPMPRSSMPRSSMPRSSMPRSSMPRSSMPRGATVIRAMNVLRQYAEPEVAAAWAQLQDRLQPGGLLLEGTCDELGRLGSWVALVPQRREPVSLTLSWHLGSVERLSAVAERLPKVLIHHNVPGEPIAELMSALDRAWAVAAPYGTYAPRQRFVAAVAELQRRGIPVLGRAARWRLGELTVPWELVRPSSHLS